MRRSCLKFILLGIVLTSIIFIGGKQTVWASFDASPLGQGTVPTRVKTNTPAPTNTSSPEPVRPTATYTEQVVIQQPSPTPNTARTDIYSNRHTARTDIHCQSASPHDQCHCADHYGHFTADYIDITNGNTGARSSPRARKQRVAPGYRRPFSALAGRGSGYNLAEPGSLR